MKENKGRPQSGLQNSIAYSGMLFMIFSIILLVHLFLDFRSKEFIANTRSQVSYQLQDHAYRIGENIEDLFTFGYNIKRFIEHKSEGTHVIDRLEFQKLASQISNEMVGIENIYLIKDQQITYHYQINDIDPVLDPHILNFIEKVKRGNKSILDNRIKSVNNKHFISIHTPIYTSNNNQHDKFWGVATITVNWLDFLSNSGVSPPHDNLQIAVRNINYQKNEPLVVAGNRQLLEDNPVLLDIPYSNKQWQIGAIPQDGWQTSPPNSWIWQLSGALLLVISMLTGWVWAQYPVRLRAIISSNRRKMHRIESGLEKQLKEGSEREINLHNILRTLPVPIVITDQNSGVNLFANEAATRLLRIPEGSTGQLASDFYVNPEMRDRLKDEIKDNGICEGLELELKRSSGQHLWALLSSVEIQYEGRDAFITGIHNITQRKNFELSLQRSEDNLHKLFDTVPTPQVIVRYNDGLILEMNLSFVEFFGINELQGTPLKLSEFFNSPDDHTRLIKEIELNGFADNVEILAHNDAGESFWLLISTETFEYGGEECLLSSLTNITERKNSELAVKQSEETLRRIFESVPTPMLFTRQKDGQILKLNTASIDILGVDCLLDTPLWISDYLDDIYDRQRLCDELYQHNVVKHFELNMHNRSGDVFSIILTATIADYEGEPAVLMGLTDITAHIQMEKELQDAMKEAQQAAEAKSEFLATMSHELRTPLNGALSMSRLLERTPLNDVQREYVDAINLSGEVLLTTISDVLDLSTIEANKLELEESNFELEPIIQNMILLLSVRAKGNSNTLDYTIDADIPDFLTGDSTRLRQVLFNLVGNALKFTENGRIFIEISRMDMPDESGAIPILFKVIDSGIGISKEQQSRLFEPFTQADSSINRQYGGSGLGLTICRRIIEIMGGEIGVDSKPGKGSTFWFRASLATGLSVPSTITQTETPLQLDKGLRILLIEDDPINQKAESALLRQDGHQVTQASDGYAAIEILKSHQDNDNQPFDLILTDIRMPGLNGLETTKLIREMPSPIGTTTVFALTGDVTRENIEICLASGIDRVLAKPVRYDELTEALRSLSVGYDETE